MFDKISNVNENENSSGELTDKYPYLGQKKIIEGQPNEYDVICRNASVLAFHLWPTIFAGAPFRLQNICQNGVPLRSRTTTPLITRYTTPPLPAHAHSNYKAMIIMIVNHVT